MRSFCSKGPRKSVQHSGRPTYVESKKLRKRTTFCLKQGDGYIELGSKTSTAAREEKIAVLVTQGKRHFGLSKAKLLDFA